MAQTNRAATLNRMQVGVKELTQQLHELGAESADGLEELKSAVDDVRMRLWSVLMAASEKDDRTFGDRFRLRRATEMLRRMLEDVDGGRLHLSNAEAGELGVAAREVGRRIANAHTPH